MPNGTAMHRNYRPDRRSVKVVYGIDEGWQAAGLVESARGGLRLESADTPAA